MAALNWYDGSLAVRLVQALLHFVWQGFAVALLTVLAGATLRHAPARARYRLYVAAMGVMIACLPVTFALVDVPDPQNARHMLRQIPAPGATIRPGAVIPDAAANRAVGIANANAGAERPSPREQAAPAVSAGSRFWSWLAPLAPQVTAAYFVGVALMTLRLAFALRGGRRLRQSAIPVADKSLLALFEREIVQMGVKVAPALAYCARISVPIVVGIVKPAILLPAALASGLAPDQLQSILAHELAHIRRFDLLVNLLQRLAEAVLFFHPAVWFVSRRVSRERELAADDLVLAAGWQPVCYADALVRMAELSRALCVTPGVAQSAALAAWDRRQSEFKRRVLRLLVGDDRPLLYLTGTGTTLFLAVLVLVALVPLLVQVLGGPAEPRRGQQVPGRLIPDPEVHLLDQPYEFQNATYRNVAGARIAPDGKRGSPVPVDPPRAAQDNDPPRPASKKPTHPRIILAQHVLLWGNEIVTWDQVVARLRTIRQSGPFRATFYSTNGLSGTQDAWQSYHDRIMALYRELFEPVGVSFASISPRASARYDAIRTAEDLRPDPKRRVSGQVVTPLGEPVRDAQVIVLPVDPAAIASGVVLSGTELRDPLDELWSPTDEKGHFDVYPTDDSYSLAVLHPSGFAIQAGPANHALVRLELWASINFISTGDVVDQRADITIKATGARPGDLGWHIFSIQTKGKPVEIKVPAGDIVVSRSLDMGQGVGISLPVEQFPLKPGESRTLELKRPSPTDRKQAQDVYQRLHGRQGNDR